MSTTHNLITIGVQCLIDRTVKQIHIMAMNKDEPFPATLDIGFTDGARMSILISDHPHFSNIKPFDDRAEFGDLTRQKIVAHSKMESPPMPQSLMIIDMLIYCPMCAERHIDEGEFADKPHHTHACQNPECGMVWRPAILNTRGVKTLPGFLFKKEHV